MKKLSLFASAVLLTGLGGVSSSLAEPSVIRRDGWSFDRSQLEWYQDSHPEEQKKAGTLKNVAGWVEYDISVLESGWYELWLTGMPSEWTREIYLDGKPILWFSSSEKEDFDPAGKDWFKDSNIFLGKGKHALRIRRLIYTAALPSAWELRPAGTNPAGSIRVTETGPNAVRVGEAVGLKIQGGMPQATSYELVGRNEENGELLSLGKVEFAATTDSIEKTVEIKFPKEGIFQLLAKANDRLLRPADLKGGVFAVVDTSHAPKPASELRTIPVVDIDCSAPPPKEGFWEKDGHTRVVDSPLGRYRESSGKGSVPAWGTDGFSYRFDLPEANRVYRLRVDYPDNDRRSMGFWVNDSPKSQNVDIGTVNTGGVETGDHYPLTNRMLTHEAFFYPRNTKNLVVAVLNLVPGMKAAAARIRIDLVESPLPAAPLGETRDRAMGFYFEESGRWLRFFGGENQSPAESFKTLERWAQWNRYIGANLMYPTVNVYQSNRYPSRILDGYFSRPLNEARLAALVAEKYQGKFIPELYLNGQKLFDWWVMGIEVSETVEGGAKKTEVRISKEAEDTVLRDRDGKIGYSSEPFVFNALHPKVQEMYINVFGELADMLADCESFIGISSRLMLSWQFQGWNALPGINYGYDDWSVAEFSKDTGVQVPGEAGDPGRFRKRFVFLTGPERERWMEWRCARLFEFHKRLLARIQKAKPSAKLFFTFHRPYQRDVSSDDILLQLRDIGMDWKRYADEPGMVIFPVALYGRRYSTPLNDADVTEAFFDDHVKKVGRLGDRGFGLGSIYYEINKHMDWAALGGGPNAAFDTCTPSGVNEREFYALALADSDSSYLENGGSGWFFGTAEIMQPFMREFRALPALPFERFDKAVDPVAVWQHRDGDGTLWFYAVNRLPVTVNASLALSGSDVAVRPAAGGERIALRSGGLDFSLEPFMMRSFRATGGELTDFQVEAPAEYVESLRPQIEAAKTFLADLNTRRLVPEATKQDAERAARQLANAIAAFDKGEYWKAHTELERLAVTRIAYASGRYLPGVLQRSRPHGVPNFSDQVPAGAQVVLDGAPGRVGFPVALAYDAKGKLWVGSDDEVAEVGASGKLVRRLPLFAPYKFDEGNILVPTLGPSQPFSPQRMFAAPDHRLVAQRGAGPPVLFDLESGRAEELEMGMAFAVPGQPCTLLAVSGGGQVFISCSSPRHEGVYEYGLDGAMRRKVSDAIASAGAVDQAGDIYLAGQGGIAIFDTNGKPIGSISQTGVKGLAVTDDGSTVFVAPADAKSIICYRRVSGGEFKQAWIQSMPRPVAALSLSPAGELAVGFQQPDGSVVARSYGTTPSGLAAKSDLALSVAEKAEQALSGFTPLKAYEGALYFESHGKLMRLIPGQPDRVQEAYDPKFGRDPGFEAFAFAPNGDLYLASKQNGSRAGVNIYRCRKAGLGWAAPEYLNQGHPLLEGNSQTVTDLAVDRSGQLVLRLDAWPSTKVTICRWNPAGGDPVELASLDRPSRTTEDYGLHQLPDGSILVAGGDTAGIWRLSPDGKTIWQTVREVTAPPGYTDLRHPLGITTDRQGAIWATDPVRNQILHFDANGKILGAFGSFGDGTDTARLSLNQPAGIAILADKSGTEWLYVADVGNRRLLKLPLVK